MFCFPKMILSLYVMNIGEMCKVKGQVFPEPIQAMHLDGLTYITLILIFRPEVGYYRNWNNPTFDLGKKKGLMLFGADLTLRY